MRFAISIFCCLLFSGECFLTASSSNIPANNPFRKQLQALSASSSDGELSVYFSGNVSGMRDTCGCAISPKGGLERRYNFAKNQSRGEGVFLDFGNLLFKSPSLDQDYVKEAVANAEKLLRATEAFDYTAINFGLLDRAISPSSVARLLGKAKLPWLSTNLEPTAELSKYFKKSIRYKLKNTEFAVLGLTSQDENLGSSEWKIKNPGEALFSELSQIPKNVFPIVLSDLELTELSKLAATVERPVVFLGSREIGGWDRPLEIGASLLLHLRHQGQEWGVLKFNPKVQDKNGWYSPRDSEHLAKRWDSLIADYKSVRSLASSDQQSVEIKQLEQRLKQLNELAPKFKDIVYDFSTVEMSKDFAGNNQLTQFTK